MKYYFRTLSKDLKLAEMLATNINAVFDELLATVALGFEPNISKLGINNKSNEAAAVFESYLTVIERSYDAQKTITMHMDMLSALLPEDISKLTQETIDKIILIIKKLPKRNIQKYKLIPVKELIKMNIPSEDKLAARGINAYIKTLRSFLNFCYKRNYIEKQFDISLSKNTIGSREERKALDINTIMKLIKDSKTTAMQSAYTLLYLTGMRLSEAYKCKISTVDGVKCFDLTDTSLKLKTKSSYRYIPVHRCITNPEKILEDIRSINPDYIIKDCSKRLDAGTLYSLRHSFATHLAKQAEPHIISELMGHKHDTMTLSRYIKGFPIKKLKSAIDILDLKL